MLSINPPLITLLLDSISPQNEVIHYCISQSLSSFVFLEFFPLPPSFLYFCRICVFTERVTQVLSASLTLSYPGPALYHSSLWARVGCCSISESSREARHQATMQDLSCQPKTLHRPKYALLQIIQSSTFLLLLVSPFSHLNASFPFLTPFFSYCPLPNPIQACAILIYPAFQMKLPNTVHFFFFLFEKVL